MPNLLAPLDELVEKWRNQGIRFFDQAYGGAIFTKLADELQATLSTLRTSIEEERERYREALEKGDALLDVVLGLPPDAYAPLASTADPFRVALAALSTLRTSIEEERERYREALEEALWVCDELEDEVNGVGGRSNLKSGQSAVGIAYLNARAALSTMDAKDE